MKKTVLFVFCCVMIKLSAQQVPWSGVDIPAFFQNSITITAPYVLNSPFLTSSSIVTQNANVDFVAGTTVHLGDGFKATDLSASGNFHARIGTAPDFDVVYIEPNEHYPQVGQFEKLEIGMTLPAAIDQQVNDFLANGTGGMNPFDPDQISVEAEFVRGVNHYTVYGFYYEDFVRDPATIQPFVGVGNETPANWFNQNTSYKWRIRFAPPYLGQWTCSIHIRLNNSTSFAYSVNDISFNCVGSSNKGWLEKGDDNWHLRYSGTHESFFALGQVMGWPDGTYFRGGPGVANYPNWNLGGFMDVLDGISNLADNGGNMIREVSVPWSYEFEFEHLNNYADRMPRAWELDQLFDLCEQRNIKVEYCIDHGVYETSTQQYLNWNNNPYHAQIPGITFVDDFLTSADAIKVYKRKLRYFASRWGYSSSLGVFELASEVNKWTYSTGSYDTNMQYDQNSWHTIMMGYIKGLLSYRTILTTSSFQNQPYENNVNFYDLSGVDITTYHPYHNERDANKKRYDEFNHKNFERGTHILWPDKPTIFEETGLTNKPADANDITGCSDVNFHNILWSTAFMGGYGVGFNYWQWNNSGFRDANFPALHSFFEGMNFETNTFNDPDFWDDNNDPTESTIETFYIRSDNRDQVMGWVHNCSYWWGNTDQFCVDRGNLTMSLQDVNNDDYTSTPQPLPEGTEFVISGLNNLSHYTYEKYDTRSTGGLLVVSALLTDFFGRLKPGWDEGAADWAYKAYRAGNNFRETSEITYDTLSCDEDTIMAQGNHVLDTLGRFRYHWDFGNGIQSDDRNAVAIYDTPGTYLATLIVSDSLGWSDTLKQYIVKLPPCSSDRISLQQENSSEHYDFKVIPNPASSAITLCFDTMWLPNINAEIYAMDGRSIFYQLLHTNASVSLPVEQLPQGTYLLSVSDGEHLKVVRIVIVH